MIVVPAFSEGDDSEPEAVLAIVAGYKAGLADDVSKRIDKEGSVVQQGRADTEAPHKHLQGIRMKLWKV